MADVSILGILQGVRHAENSITAVVTEYRSGYKKNDGIMVPEQTLEWKVIFKAYFKKYISTHFDSGMLVQIKGIILPYQFDGEHNTENGYTIYGQTIDRASYQKNTKREYRMIKESHIHSNGVPDLETFKQDDF